VILNFLLSVVEQPSTYKKNENVNSYDDLFPALPESETPKFQNTANKWRVESSVVTQVNLQKKKLNLPETNPSSHRYSLFHLVNANSTRKSLVKVNRSAFVKVS
jgi:hypothetical protein